MADGSLSRRELLRRSGGAGALLALPAMATTTAAAAATAPPPQATAPPDVYGAIGVRPLINARGTFTIISGSTMLPEVRAAIDAASRRYVHLDELAEAIGARLATLTQAEWGLVTSGCSAGLTHATAACVAGGNPELHVRIPNLQGFAKDEVIIPSHSRNVYDAAIRAVGVRVVDGVDGRRARGRHRAADGARSTCWPAPSADKSELSVKAMGPIAKAKNVPILVDAAAEILTIPNVHLGNGATLVAYSGGKCLRGPQTAGLLLGRKDLVKAAWVHSAPHHGPHRGYKVGKEEAIGMLAAVETWVKRDHEAETKRWTGWLDQIAAKVKTVDGVTTEIVQPAGLSNKTPSLRIRWDRAKLGVDGPVVVRTLFNGEPRITMSAAGGARGRRSIGDERDRRVDHPVHDGRGRRADHRGSAARRAEQAAGHAGQDAGPAGRRPVRRLGREDPVRRVGVHASPPAATEGRGHRGRAPRRLRHPRSHRIDRRRRGAAAQQRRRTGRRRVLVHVHRQARPVTS